MASPNHLDPNSVVSAVIEGVEEARLATKTKVNLIGIISRTYGVEIGYRELDAILAYKEKLVGLDLAGDEANFPAAWFKEHFQKGQDAGLGITVHAGEAAGAESVWEALKILGAKRIGHAVRINEDPNLVDYILENKIGIEANLTSNFQTSTIPSLSEHPIKGWLEIGMRVTINTDDPGISAIDLPYEFNVAAPQAGLDASHTKLAQKYAVEMAFISEQDREIFFSSP